MGNEQRLKLIDEIKNIERMLYLKISQLASSEVREYSSGANLSDLKGSNLSKCREIFSTLIQKVGATSSGGNSVDDINFDRQR